MRYSNGIHIQPPAKNQEEAREAEGEAFKIKEKESPMIQDVLLTAIAVALSYLSYDRDRQLCFLIALNMSLCTVINAGLVAFGLTEWLDPWYFFFYPLVDLSTIVLLTTFISTRKSKYSSLIFLASMVYSYMVFAEFVYSYWVYGEGWQGAPQVLYDYRPYFMTGVCASLLLMMASGGRLRTLYNGLLAAGSSFVGRMCNSVFGRVNTAIIQVPRGR